MIFQDAIPHLKTFLKPAALRRRAQALVIRCIVAFLMHRGTMSASQAAGSIRTEARHRAQISRFFGRGYWKRTDLLGPLRRPHRSGGPAGRPVHLRRSTRLTAPSRASAARTPSVAVTIANDPGRATASRRRRRGGRATASSWGC